ncbi:hypothetical protein VSDG_01881 [Cytospora chrysosperma]|uniref:Uncharacterized protein n=1 Tax=Cytospora chrysosperma TaxID=252740 RepID=A0A423WHD0_CYTCH|nr:hypothetical protein VSDG_01881 [Valsa sordida]
MNTSRLLVAWPPLTRATPTAGAGAYVFAKKSINADRQARLEEQNKKRAMIASLENASNASSQAGKTPVNDGSPPNECVVASPGREMDTDPAPVRHQPLTEHERVYGRSKYEAAEPYKSKKGDRFSDM